MKKVIVPVRFIGRVEVNVPDNVIYRDALLLAKKLALSRAFASIDNPDAPDEEAFEEYRDGCSIEACDTAEADWDGSSVTGIGGVWKAGRDSALKSE